MGSVTHTPKAGATLTGAEYESDPHTISLDAADIPTHSHAGEDITSGTVADGRVASTLARDSEVTAAVSDHEGAADPHTGYLKESDFTGVDFLVGTATGITAAEIVVGTSPGGELGGTWASPTVDATHSGSTHAATQAAAEATAASALSAHAAAGDPHPGYLTSAEGNAAYQPLDSDLTAIAALTTTSFGRSLLAAADAAALRTLADSPSNAEAILDAIVDAKGDIIAGTAADTVARLAAGANGTVLVAASGESTGLKWGVHSGFHGCRVRKSTSFSHNSSGSLLAITFDTEDYDTDGYHDTGANTTRVTIPSGLGGYYHIVGSVEWDTNTTNDRGIQLYLNGTTEIAWIRLKPHAQGVAYEIQTDYLLAATDYVELRAYQDSGGTRTIAARAATSPLLSVALMGV